MKDHWNFLYATIIIQNKLSHLFRLVYHENQG